MQGVKNRNWLIRGVLCGAMIVAPARAADVADRVPDNAMIAIEWTKLAENNVLFDVGRAILDCPLLANEHDRDIVQMRALFDFVEIAGRHAGIVAITPPGTDGLSEPQLYCVVDAGADAPKLVEQIKQTLKSGEPSEAPAPVTFGALTFQRFGDRPDAAHVAMQKDLVLLT